ncbi:hypothetical protein [Brachybacterium sacelli]|uniref:Uncharacterized protein n=1 Tax=Brachybacterium sacelli TaxID=173364 RepID=A0ABS4X631_9MICO|nr:hypothetical protein [Brachybacterium sacelli]MBP2383925.1 hypothetical protein [Brachybacterium sacelli]
MESATPPRQLAAAAALAPHSEGDPQALLSITDEEILALTENGAGFDLPWVVARESRPEGFSREDARLSAARSLISRGFLAPESALAQLEQREVEGGVRPQESHVKSPVLRPVPLVLGMSLWCRVHLRDGEHYPSARRRPLTGRRLPLADWTHADPDAVPARDRFR